MDKSTTAVAGRGREAILLDCSRIYSNIQYQSEIREHRDSAIRIAFRIEIAVMIIRYLQYSPFDEIWEFRLNRSIIVALHTYNTIQT